MTVYFSGERASRCEAGSTTIGTPGERCKCPWRFNCARALGDLWKMSGPKMTGNLFEMQFAVRLLVASVLFAGGISSAPVLAEEDAFVCMEQTKEKCDWENRNIQLFV